jgi:hypothetical protein
MQLSGSFKWPSGETYNGDWNEGERTGKGPRHWSLIIAAKLISDNMITILLLARFSSQGGGGRIVLNFF